MELFTSADFKIFDVAGFHERMGAIILKVRPKLTSIGEALVVKISPLVDRPLFVHVAKHARRTVNPPDDTWAAFGPDSRGYKKDVHFKIAVSRHCVRFLFEAGPEYYAKTDWADEWSRSVNSLAPELRATRSLAWFRNEHDEDSASAIKDLSSADLKKLGDELTRRRDGQLVLGRRIDAREFISFNAKRVEKIAVEVFTPLASLFNLHEARSRMAASVGIGGLPAQPNGNSLR